MMKSMVLAAGAVLTLGFGSAFAAERQSTDGTWFAENPALFSYAPRDAGFIPVSRAIKRVWY